MSFMSTITGIVAYKSDFLLAANREKYCKILVRESGEGLDDLPFLGCSIFGEAADRIQLRWAVNLTCADWPYAVSPLPDKAKLLFPEPHLRVIWIKAKLMNSYPPSAS